MKVEELIKLAPEIHMEGTVTFGLLPMVLEYIESRVSKDSVTIETGAGFSTILFAMKGCRHICISPVENEIKRIIHFCDTHKISTDNIQFCIGRSEDVLPHLDNYRYDLGLIDGGHGFPIPIIDFFYIARKLKDQGLLIIDDTRIWSVHIVREFLIHDECWSCEFELPHKTICLRKISSGSESKEWIEQPFVMKEPEKYIERTRRKEQITRIKTHLKKLEFGVLSAKAIRRLWRGIKGIA